uniref:SMP-30/Gluconolactonase/LRE-like region domain-containing protein n=1 Tax=Timspurckia oligopyrenoides TaxID=708627 RepID=A0A7S0ZAH3_9RHOD|mmetsp:Transcript_10177/g.18328  ORF Transcript_10177/g.18328 Transcript_10177/m.18328 type:complete len:538 (+) Transcript_10177:86-1699(+)
MMKRETLVALCVGVLLALAVQAAILDYELKEPQSLDFAFTGTVGPGGALFGQSIDKNLRLIGASGTAFQFGGAELEAPPNPNPQMGESVLSAGGVEKYNNPFTFSADSNFTNAELTGCAWGFVGGPASSSGRVFIYTSCDLEIQELENPATEALENVTVTVSTGGMNYMQTLLAPGAANQEFGRSMASSSFKVLSTETAGGCLITELLVGAPAASGGRVFQYIYNGQVPADDLGSFEISTFNIAAGSNRLFGFSMDYAGGTLMVGAPGSNTVAVYSRTTDPIACTIAYSPVRTLSGPSGARFGQSVSIGQGFQLVGAPQNGRGTVSIYQGASLRQTLDVDSTGESRAANIGSAIDSQAGYIAVGAAGVSPGFTFIYKVDPETSLFTVTQALENPDIIPQFGGAIAFDSCRTLYVGSTAGTNIVNRYGADIGAYYDDFCTCAQQTVEPYYVPIPESENNGTTLCFGQMRTTNFVCDLTGMDSICNYRDQVGYIWLNGSPTEPDTVDDCVLVEPNSRIVRRRAGGLCLYVYTEPFSLLR